MLVHIIFVCGVLHPILHYYSVFGKRETLQRYVIEEGAKPPIFGSYSYDPVKQVFMPPPSEDGDEDLHQEPQPAPPPVLQTIPGPSTITNCLNDTRRPIFRKHVSEGPEPTGMGTEPTTVSVSVSVSTNATPGFPVPVTNWWDKPNTPKTTTPKNITSNIINK
ncbi:uncharacterized protein LOC118267263 [Spodoptera frugiperda]|uniref:Uncharacterized protein LOC118267263 n=1 Tax=Spodoptera frugiperda TaxID=7108 RepID=A0A9R0D1V8_SPOFR|nr:uncharacterized protein LOC118267263 [Spodoptera frugiperda]